MAGKTLAQEVGERLRARQTEVGISNTEVGRRLAGRGGISSNVRSATTTYERMRAGKGNRALALLDELAEVLMTTPGYLRGDGDGLLASVDPDQVAALLAEVRSLREEQGDLRSELGGLREVLRATERLLREVPAEQPEDTPQRS